MWTFASSRASLLQRLADQEDVLVVLASRDAMAMVCNEVCHSSKSIFSLRVNVGSRLVLPYSAMGLALLGAMTPEERAEALRQISRSFKKNWQELQELIEAAVEQFRRCGFCTTLETLESGINGIAVAIDTPGAPHSFTIGLAGPSFRFRPSASSPTSVPSCSPYGATSKHDSPNLRRMRVIRDEQARRAKSRLPAGTRRSRFPAAWT